MFVLKNLAKRWFDMSREEEFEGWNGTSTLLKNNSRLKLRVRELFNKIALKFGRQLNKKKLKNQTIINQINIDKYRVTAYLLFNKVIINLNDNSV